MNKKGFEEEGMKFNIKQVSIIIIIIVTLAIAMILLFPKLAAQRTGEASAGFGKYLWDLLGGK